MKSKSIWIDLLRRSLNLLPPGGKLKIGFIIAFQLCLAFLDLVGVAIVGLLGALSVTGVQSTSPAQGGKVARFLELLNLDSLPFQQQVAVLGVLAAVILTLRTLISILFARRALYFLSYAAARISSDLFRKLLTLSLIDFRVKTSQEILYILTIGVNTITVGIVGTSMALAADLFLMTIMFFGLVVVNTAMAVGTLAAFSLISFLLYKLLHQRARELGELNAQLSIKRNDKILEVMKTYRESLVKGRRKFYADKVEEIRFRMASTEAELSFMPNISKYTLEITTVLGAILLCGTVFYFQDAKHAVATLVVFLAAGSRIAPAVLRFQQGALYFRSSIGSALPALDLIESLGREPFPSVNESKIDFSHPGFTPELHIQSLSFRYPNKTSNAVDDINLKIREGSTVAIVGPSGAGKTSLVDLMLGIITPNNGEILISSNSPSEAIRKWPSAIGYVPQDVAITSGSIRENVCLGYPENIFSEDEVWAALSFAQLSTHVSSLSHGLDSEVGENGIQLSGGQRQRLGIARAMVTRPKLLILDEATSSLDGQTESALTESIDLLHGEVTVVVIAHRLSTIKSADHVIYMENGKILAQGTFESVRQAVPNFDTQAQLMGL